MPSTISLTEYRMLHPDIAAFPTLSQSGLLGLLLERRRLQDARLARRQARRSARRRASRARYGRWWAKLRAMIYRPVTPAFVGVARHP